MGIEYFDFSIATGASRAIDCRADFVRYMAGSAGGADESIIVKSAQGGIEVKLKPGQSFKIDTPQNRWYVQGVSGSTVIGDILFAEGGTLDDSTVAGVVSIVDGGKSRTLGKNAFIKNLEFGATAGNYSTVQIFNPTTTKNVVIEQMLCSFAVAGSIVWVFNQTQLATLGGNAPSKFAGGSASSAELRTESKAVPVAGTGIFDIQVNANSPVTINLREPLILPPGWGLNIYGSVPANYLIANVEFYEELI